MKNENMNSEPVKTVYSRKFNRMLNDVEYEFVELYTSLEKAFKGRNFEVRDYVFLNSSNVEVKATLNSVRSEINANNVVTLFSVPLKLIDTVVITKVDIY